MSELSGTLEAVYEQAIPSATLEEVRTFYDTWGESYDKVNRSIGRPTAP